MDFIKYVNEQLLPKKEVPAFRAGDNITVYYKIVEGEGKDVKERIQAFRGDVIQIKMTSREVKKCSLVLVFKYFNKKTKAYYGEGWQRIAFVDSNTGKICVIPHYILDLALPIQQENQNETKRRVK